MIDFLLVCGSSVCFSISALCIVCLGLFLASAVKILWLDTVLCMTFVSSARPKIVFFFLLRRLKLATFELAPLAEADHRFNQVG
jgi:hypothetical protein